jgi:4,5-DOPA dioxygenase extradiol
MIRQPAIFIGHGNPLNAILKTPFAQAWEALGRQLARPRAILAISAHWYVNGVAVTAMSNPRTIHDFGGFPPELYAVEYPAPGSPALAAAVAARLSPVPVRLDEHWGLDHGTWSVLCRLFPEADIPVVQLSLDRQESGSFHYDLGRRLAPLRDEGVLIIGSGDIVHNLGAYKWGDPDGPPYDWAVRFENRVRQALTSRDHDALIAWEGLGAEARLAIPTPEHYLPLLYVLGASDEADQLEFPVVGIEGGAVSMLSIMFSNQVTS